jgi:hypothetical protein
MACYSPIQAYRNPFDHVGPLLFSPPHSGFSDSANIALSGLKIPCVAIFTTMEEPNFQRLNLLAQPLHKFLKMKNI